MKYTVITEYEAEQMFDEYLDDSTEPVKLGFGTFYASKILKNCDPIAYDLGLSEFYDHLAGNADIYVLGYTDDLKPTDDEDEEDDE
jgi:hypothetical protein